MRPVPTKESIKRIAEQVDWAYDQLWHERPVGEVLNVLLARGLTRKEAIVCVEQAQKEMES